jgi:hypothetical protein
MPLIDLAPPSWEAVPEDVPKTLSAAEVVLNPITSLLDASGAVGDEVWMVL